MTHINTKYPLVIEQHPDDYTGYPFITLIMYGDNVMLTIVDNQDKHNIYAYVIDHCNIENINELDLIKIASTWYYGQKNYPVSIEFIKQNIPNINKLYKTFNINYIKRIIGPVPKYNMDLIKKTKRKKCKISDVTLEICYNSVSDIFSS